MTDDPQKHEEPRGGRAGVLAGLAIAVALVLLSLWVARSLIDMVRQQNCAMSGRRDCLDVNR